jgi:predicted nuclease of restriction endonuclease-like (RecB) superfamily
LLIAIDDDYKREYYELEATHNGWTGRELERQINSLLYECLLLSNDKESVLAVARKAQIPAQSTEIIKDPMFLEFLGLKREAHYYEQEIESALITYLQEFLLELGNGFSFITRQKRILLFQRFAFHLAVNACVDFGGFQIRMAKDVPDIHQVHPCMKQMHRFRVAETVREIPLIARPLSCRWRLLCASWRYNFA